MPSGGYIHLHRSCLQSAVFDSEPLWRLWSYLLLSASWKERELPDGTILKPGDMVCSNRRIATDLGWGVSKVHRWVKRLEDLGNIMKCHQSGTQAQIITICNWEVYNNASGQYGTANGTQTERKRNAARNIKKKEEEGKKGNKEDLDYDFPPGMDCMRVRMAIQEWLDYKQMRREAYKKPFHQISRLLKMYPDPQVFQDAVEASIAQNYAGMFPARGAGRSDEYGPHNPHPPVDGACPEY